MHTKVDLLRWVIDDLRDSKVRSVTTLSLLNVHSLGESLPHAVLPLQIVLFHALIIVTLTALTNPDSSELLQITVDVASNEVVMLISLVPETENDVFETGKLVLAVRELKRLVRKVLAELNGVVRGFTLTIGSHNEENTAVLRELAEVLKVAFLGVTHE